MLDQVHPLLLYRLARAISTFSGGLVNFAFGILLAERPGLEPWPYHQYVQSKEKTTVLYIRGCEAISRLRFKRGTRPTGYDWSARLSHDPIISLARRLLLFYLTNLTNHTSNQCLRGPNTSKMSFQNLLVENENILVGSLGFTEDTHILFQRYLQL